MTMGHSAWKYPVLPTLYVLYIVLSSPVSCRSTEIQRKIQNVTATGEIGKPAVMSCIILPHNSTAVWLFDGKTIAPGDGIKITNETRSSDQKDIDGAMLKYTEVKLNITEAKFSHAGEYSCKADWGEMENVTLRLSYPGKLISVTKGPLTANVTSHQKYNLTCVFEVYNQTTVKWIQYREGQEPYELTEETATYLNPKQIQSTYPISIDSKEHNGTYVCLTYDVTTQPPTEIKGQVDVIVYARPDINIHEAIAISTHEIFINWTINKYNVPITHYDLFYYKGNNSSGKYYTDSKIDVRNTTFVMKGLNKSTAYKVRLTVHNEFGQKENSNVYPSGSNWVTTLKEDPVFVPNISINGFSAKSMTIGLWTPSAVANFTHYYILEANRKGETNKIEAIHLRDDSNLPYMFDNLQPHSTYIFKAKACSSYTSRCGNWSEPMEAVTLDGIPDKPSNVQYNCVKEDNRFHMTLEWGPPEKPNAEIKGYMIEVTGNSTYKDRFGHEKTDTWGPLSKFMKNDSMTTRVDDLKPNTLYTVRLSAVTRTRRRGVEEARHCRTPPAPPDTPPRPRWRKIAVKEDKYMLKVSIPRVSERNGPVCCYRVYLVKLPAGADWSKLPQPQELPVISYEDAHAPTPEKGAYVTDILNHEHFEDELLLGDGNSRTIPNVPDDECSARCFQRPKPKEQPPTRPPPPTTTTGATTELVDEPETTGAPEERSRRETQWLLYDDAFEYVDGVQDRSRRNLNTEDIIVPKDGPLDSRANYTLFVELIPGTKDESLYSSYTPGLSTALIPLAPMNINTMELALQVSCAVAALLLLLAVALCVLHTRRSRKPRHAHLELNPIQAALRYVVGHMGGRAAAPPPTPPDMPAIPRAQLAAAYAERQADSDYGFQKEFEQLQILPECFPDRTTHASEARENQPKNRYPDIKAYDQTRVKLSQIDGIVGSDYINANYVMGYKERKKFICAQGPTDTTVNDFWRMIWEHGLELIVMLTNLEEYSKVKCSKYWPDEIRGTRAFGAITVQHVSEKRYSDYIVRELKITKQPTNSEGQPIVDTNGVAKRNGDCKDIEAGSAPTSPREKEPASAASAAGQPRTVRQYHFLMWKDFAAPEHPHSILKFIKRVNEAWSGLLGRPAVVHCSAGVGRTGTLVALDCLLEQLRATGHAAVFNTVAELRRQRNFLVQSLKQYVFVYRALVEYAHYGDTEIPASRLKSSIDRLRNTPEGADKCLMEHELEKMLNSPVAEAIKSCAAGAAEEVRAKNRSQDCLPYDRNRVILTPLPTRDFSTYINASFIEAYDNSEGFIITQDPLPNTIMDFWRMVSEHNVATIVMLSELGESKCPRYWEDGTAQYEHIGVQYEESESCPYYTRRQFRVTNNKSGDVSSVRQLQYHGWPTAPGHVPEVTRGLAELADAAAPALEPCPALSPAAAPHRPMLIHCQYGTERAPLFAALCVLIAQLRTERRVDVNAVARKVRDQRARTVDTFLQYEFLHRAILNYAELHNLLEDS